MMMDLLGKTEEILAGPQYFQNGHLLLPVSVSEEDTQIIQDRDHVLPTISFLFPPFSFVPVGENDYLIYLVIAVYETKY